VARLPSGEPMIELPFALRRGQTIIRGRIDAVYETDDGGLEIVDFKTGGRFSATDDDQLDLYAHALAANGLMPEGRPVKLTYAFLDGGKPESRDWPGTAHTPLGAADA
jgi:DNA helicase-2/ATP-dependent DNA helicase PcrA